MNRLRFGKDWLIQKIWSAFEKIYTLHNEQTASDEMLNDFKKQVVGYLADMYAEFHQLHIRFTSIIFKKYFKQRVKRSKRLF